VAFSIFLCFFLRMRFRRFLMREPTGPLGYPRNRATPQPPPVALLWRSARQRPRGGDGEAA
jgi:hypothetical protein